ncbi:Uncharacterized protein PBTT_06198 [Plasmodiophora brassicae]
MKRLYSLLDAIDIGLDVERIVAERAEKLVREYSDVVDEDAAYMQLEVLLGRVLPLVADPTETFVNLWAKYYHMVTMPIRLLELVVPYAVKMAPAPASVVSSWAHQVVVRMLRLQTPIRQLVNVIGWMHPGTHLLSGIGSSILRDYDLCAHADPVGDWNAIASAASDDVVRQALASADPISGRTTLHQHCMTVDVLHWIRGRADPQWLRAALMTTTVSTRTCLDLWLVGQDGSMRPEDDVVGLLRAYSALAGLESTPMCVVVAERCSVRTQTYLHVSQRIQRWLYLLGGPGTVHAIDELAQQAWPAVDDPSTPGLAFALLSRLLTSPAVETYRRIRARVFAANNGAYLQAHNAEVLQWTPLHFAIALPSLHAYVPEMLETALEVGIIEQVLVAKDALGRTFLHVAAESWANCLAHPRYHDDGKAFKDALTRAMQIVMKPTTLASLVDAFVLLAERDGSGWTIQQRIRQALDSERQTKPDAATVFLHALVRDAI